MSMYRIRREFDDIVRTARLESMEDLRDRWINEAWEKINEEFVVPAMVRTIRFNAVENQEFYLFPYDYNGGEIGLKYNNRRLDPVPDETLRLQYEKRQGNMGIVRYYDWSGNAGEDLKVIENVTLTNNSKLVLTGSDNPILNRAYWVRFDPYQDASNTDKDYENMVDPGEYGYLIHAGKQVAGTSFELTYPYRGPSGDQFTMRVQPAEQPRFVVYGVPSSDGVDAFELRYPTRPRRLYNNSDVPECPNMEVPIAYMAVSIALEWMHNIELARTFWGRAVARITNLSRRRHRAETLVTDLTIGSVVGRKTGPHGIYTTRGFRSGIGRYR